MDIQNIPKFVINLGRDVHKFKRFLKPIKEQNINFKIWRGAIITDIKQLKIYHSKYKYTKNTKTINYSGNVGSSFAHLSLWTYCLNQDDDYFMIFEDNQNENGAKHSPLASGSCCPEGGIRGGGAD